MLLSTPFMGLFLAQRSGEMDAAVVEPLPGEALPGEPVPIPDEQIVTDQEFAEPLVPVAPQLSPIARADLIQSTDANERLQQISDGRTDPFATVPIPPPPQIIAPPPPPGGSPTPGAPAAGTTAVAPGTPGVAPGATTPGGTGLPPTATAPGTPGAASPGATPGVPGAGQPAAGTPPPLAPLPALPQPTLAQAVQVTGVMTIGSENFAVVQTGSGSQYVRAGQRVSNGQVLVKRIDMRGSEPTVVLEENGIEVSRPVGPPVTADEQPSA
ncbi:hypothetical protein [Nodosilinea sp. E11]|uniref:hypothetical protein n=1 Tax=Nodosilinea sp. E11 TaxID=3037479 RepID=UPI002934F760|nr:hypothetical protein [Nodosilinea sp. E11]WOD38356.1 hypothetical protein RRF56_19285 [Nodosilinea sp. E11]